MSQTDFKNLPFVSKEKSDLAYREVNGEKFWLSNHGVHTLIYPTWNINTFSAGKAGSIVFTPRDAWFFDIEESDARKYHWRTGLEQLKKVVPDYWRNDAELFQRGLKGCWSKDYFLEN